MTKGLVALRGERRNAHKVFAGEGQRKRSPGRARNRWNNTIKMNLQEIGWLV
jgi:hypothetical protein